MSNKTQLQTNNTNLASYTDRVTALIDVANGLPEAGGSGTAPEWQDVFALPTTYVIDSMNEKSFYVEKPYDFKAIIVRFINQNNQYCRALVALDSSSISHLCSTNSGESSPLFIFSYSDVIEILVEYTNGSPNVSSAEYLII